MTAPLSREETAKLGRDSYTLYDAGWPGCVVGHARLTELLRGYEAWRDGIEKIVPLLESLRRGHYECEDCWYSCPLSEEGCCNDTAPKECSCGSTEQNEIIDRALDVLRAGERK